MTCPVLYLRKHTPDTRWLETKGQMNHVLVALFATFLLLKIIDIAKESRPVLFMFSIFVEGYCNCQCCTHALTMITWSCRLVFDSESSQTDALQLVSTASMFDVQFIWEVLRTCR